MTTFEDILKEDEKFQILLEKLDGLIEYGKTLTKGEKQ